MDTKEHIIISLGGSLIVPDEVDTVFLKDFVENIKQYVSHGFRFVIITGGGRTARNYIEALKGITSPSDVDLDWIGIASTRINAELLRVSFDGIAHDAIILNPDETPNTDMPVIIGGGWKPGNSSDLAAVRIAKVINSKKLINLSNIDYAYNKDPKAFPDAIKIEETNWADFRKILPPAWKPGLSAPFDPIAAQEAEALGLEVVIMNGKHIENFNNYLNGDKFEGTVIR